MNNSTSKTSKATIDKTLKLLELFRSLDPRTEMTLGEAISFLLIAKGEQADGSGITVTELAQQGNIAMASASRYMRGLSKKDRQGNAGLELVTDQRDPLDDRRKVLRISSKGHRTLDDISKIIGG